MGVKRVLTQVEHRHISNVPERSAEENISTLDEVRREQEKYKIGSCIVCRLVFNN
jgi:hypothetical protein